MSARDPRVGLFVEPRQICLAEVAGGPGGPRIVRSAEAEVPEGGAADPALMAEILRQVVLKSGIRSRQVVVALGSLDAIIRRFSMPLLPRKEWPNAVRFEAQKYLPFDVRDLYTDADIVSDKAKRQLDVVFVAAKKESVTGILELLRRVDLEATAIEPVACALHRLLQLGVKKEAPGVSTYVHVDRESGMTLLIANPKSLWMTREGALAAVSTAEPVSNGVDPETIASEIRLSLDYFAKHFREEAVRKIILFESPASAGMESVLTRLLGLPVETRDPMKLLRGHVQPTLGMVGAAGVALRGLNIGSAKRFNLVPEEAKSAARSTPLLSREDLQQQIVFSALTGLVLGAAAAGLAYLPVRSEVNAAQQEVQAVQQSYPPLQSNPVPATVGEAEVLADKLAKEAKFLSEVMTNRIVLTHKLSELAKATPSGVWLTALEYEDRRLADAVGPRNLRMEGAVYLEDGKDHVVVINRFASALRENTVFMSDLDSLKIEGIRKAVIREADVTTFTLKAEAAQPSVK